MGQLVPAGLRALSQSTKPEPIKCQAVIEDFENGTHYNLSRSFTVPEHRPCRRNARSKIGTLCFCTLHTRLALEGLIDDDGQVASRSVIQDVRKYPKKFTNGIYSWARGLKAEEIK
jgi:hypothetical protein